MVVIRSCVVETWCEGRKSPRERTKWCDIVRRGLGYDELEEEAECGSVDGYGAYETVAYGGTHAPTRYGPITMNGKQQRQRQRQEQQEE